MTRFETGSSTMDTRVRDEAAQWFVRLQDGQLSAEERQCFDAWRAEQPEHQYEFDVLQGLWNATDLLPKARLQWAWVYSAGWASQSRTVPSSVPGWASIARWPCPTVR